MKDLIAELEGLRGVLASHIEALRRAEDRLRALRGYNMVSDLTLWRLTLGGLLKRVDTVLDEAERGNLILSSAEACSLSEQARHILVRGRGESGVLANVKPLLLYLSELGDKICRAQRGEAARR